MEKSKKTTEKVEKVENTENKSFDKDFEYTPCEVCGSKYGARRKWADNKILCRVCAYAAALAIAGKVIVMILS